MADSTDANNSPEKLPTSAYLMCGWPMFLVAIGGVIGGGLGGAAFGINLTIYKSRLPLGAKIILNLLAGIAAIVLWIVINAAIQKAVSARPT